MDTFLVPQNTFIPFPRTQLEESIPRCFERQAARRSDSIAVKDSSKILTYLELNQAANRVAHILKDSTTEILRPVALLFNHNAAMVIAMLGTLKAGGFYIPLDPSHPQTRNLNILREVQASIILTDSEGLNVANAYSSSDIQIINLDVIDCTLGNENLELTLSPQTPACILYTSGSTGGPKGVLLDHRAVLHRVMLYTNDYFICETDRLSLVQMYMFNASIRDIYGALLNGAGLFLYNLKKEGIHHLAGWLVGEGITVFYAVPAIFRVFLDTLQNETFDELRLVRLGGEPMLARDVDGFQRHFDPRCILANGLASTETGTTCQYFMNHQTRIVGDRVPVGFPVADKEIYLLDEGGNPVKDGMIGEMVVESPYLGPGYCSQVDFKQDIKPAASNLSNRIIHTGDLGFRSQDGRLNLVGRKDWVVKIHGQQFNIAEIEQALLNLENVDQAAVIYHTAPDGVSFLAAFIQPKTQPAPAEVRIRQVLRVTLPEVMIPSVFMFLDSLPKTLSGKVDRHALPDPILERIGIHETIDPPATHTEEVLAEIWGELLGLHQVGVNENFFDLGGDSLRASILMAQMEAKFGRKLPLAVLFQNNTIKKMAELFAAEDAERSHTTLITLQPLGRKSPVYFLPPIDGELLVLYDLVGNMGTDHPLFGLQGVVYGDSPEKLTTVDQIAAKCVREIRVIQPKGPYYLAGYSFGGHIALEMGRQLMALGEQAPFVALLDTFPPGPKRNTTFFKRVMIHLRNMQKFKRLQDFDTYFSGGMRRILFRSIRHRPARAIANQFGVPLKFQISAAQLALSAYKPLPYPGKVVLFICNQREWYVNWDPMSTWKDFIAGGLEIREVPGNHDNLIKNPFVRELARQLLECLDRDLS